MLATERPEAMALSSCVVANRAESLSLSRVAVGSAAFVDGAHNGWANTRRSADARVSTPYQVFSTEETDTWKSRVISQSRDPKGAYAGLRGTRNIPRLAGLHCLPRPSRGHYLLVINK